ncbi:MAG: Hsp20/alpha crystallin family protein [Gemmatimonadaceae bacterium]|jgi:HSP20 family protein|nr:Hsp20/alpha crystallin family protein [Gemmatimonadaceae bacterium]
MTYRFAVPTRRLGAELDQFFDAVFPVRPARDGRPATGWTPAAHAVEAADRYVISLDLPGVPADKLQVVAEQGRLRVSGERPALSAEGTAHVAERRYGAFERSFRLPEAVDAGKIEATVADGVLTITLPKREPAIARTIEIRTV